MGITTRTPTNRFGIPFARLERIRRRSYQRTWWDEFIAKLKARDFEGTERVWREHQMALETTTARSVQEEKR